MSLDLIEGPATEPVSLADAKAHLRVDGTAEDAFITTLIVTSRLHVEAALGIALVSQRWAWRIDGWHESGGVVLPLRPLISVDAVRVTPSSGSPVVVDSASYLLDATGNPARLVPKSMALPVPGVPIQGIEIEFTAGFGDASGDVPAPIRQAILLLVAHWYENREPVARDATPAKIPVMVSDLLQPYRTVRL